MGIKGKSKALDWLLAHVNYQGEECLIWPFSFVRGYGRLKHLGELHYAHTYMCKLAHGPAPSPTHQPAHSCGRGDKGCTHPKHLSWKTPEENQQDKALHGTAYRATQQRKLTEPDVILIRCFNGCATHDQMAAQLGVSRRTIGAVADRRSWDHVL
jgi:hypothetical protein